MGTYNMCFYVFMEKLKLSQNYHQIILLQKSSVAYSEKCINSSPPSSDFCRLLISFVNSLDPDQALQNVGPDLDPNYLTL